MKKSNIEKENETNLQLFYESAKFEYEKTYSMRNTMLSRANLALSSFIALLALFFTTLNFKIFYCHNKDFIFKCLLICYGIFLVAILIVSVIAIARFVKLNKSIKLKAPNLDEFYFKLLEQKIDISKVNKWTIAMYLQAQKKNEKTLNDANEELDKNYKLINLIIVLMCICVVFRFIIGG